MLSLISELKEPKKLKVLMWQAKFESGIIFLEIKYAVSLSILSIVTIYLLKMLKHPAKSHYFSLAHPTGDGTNLRSSPLGIKDNSRTFLVLRKLMF